MCVYIVCVCVHVCAHLCVGVYMRACVYVNMSLCMHLCVCAYVCMCVVSTPEGCQEPVEINDGRKHWNGIQEWVN